MRTKEKKTRVRSPVSLTPEQVIRKRLRRIADREEVSGFLSKLVMFVVMMWVMFGVIFGITPMQNNDMSPRLSSGDLMLYYRLEDTFRSQDIIIFEKEGRQYTGRIIARGGESVEITDDSQLIVNGSHVVETDIFYRTPKYGEEVEYPLQLGDREYFVLCDYRDGARDSRYFGAVSQEEIRGKALAVISRSHL